AMLHGPDDVLGAEGRITPEKDPWPGGLEGHGIHFGHVPLVELDAEIGLDPGEGVLLADGEDHIVRWNELLARHPLGRDAAAGIELIFHDVEGHADEPSGLHHESLGRAVDDDLDTLFFGVLDLPFRGLEEAARLARHHLDLLRPEPQARAAAVHRGVADADDENTLADLPDMAEGHRLQPRDADMHVGSGGLPTGQVEILAFRGARADEYGIESAARKQRLHAADGMPELQVDSHVDDHADLLLEHRLRQAEGGDVGAHQTTGLAILLEDRDLVAERHEIIGHREGGTAGADAGDPLAVLDLRDGREPAADVIAIVRSHPLQAADGHGLGLDAAATAGGLARPVADAHENARENVGVPVDEVSLGKPALSNQSDVLRDVGMG